MALRIADARATFGGALDVARWDPTRPIIRPGPFGPGCPVAVEQLVNYAKQSADLVHGAPLLQDVSLTCNAVSVGIDLEFEPTPEPFGAVPDPTVDPCSDAGVDG